MPTPQLRVLIAYATRHGSTREVADFVGRVAAGHGATVEVVPAHSVATPLASCDLVVLGAPLYSGRWHRAAGRFLRRHRKELSTMPVAVFALGPRRDDEEAWRRSWDQLHRALATRPWLRPVSTGLFGGADPVRRRRTERRDLRDWTAVRAWADETLAAVAGVAGSGPATVPAEQ